MDKSQKLMLLSFLPLLLAFIFLFDFLLPCFNNFNDVKEKLNTKKAEVQLLKEKAKQSQENKKMYDQIQNVEKQLGNFDCRVPQNKDLEILLIDLERFATDSNLKIVSMEAKPSVVVELIDPKKTKNKRKSSRVGKQIAPLSIFKIPTDIEVVGYYPDVIKFVGKLEKYQRLISIDGVSAQNSKKDQDKGSSKVSMKISANIYIQQENIVPDEEDVKDQDSNSKDSSNDNADKNKANEDE